MRSSPLISCTRGACSSTSDKRQPCGAAAGAPTGHHPLPPCAPHRASQPTAPAPALHFAIAFALQETSRATIFRRRQPTLKNSFSSTSLYSPCPLRAHSARFSCSLQHGEGGWQGLGAAAHHAGAARRAGQRRMAPWPRHPPALLELLDAPLTQVFNVVVLQVLQLLQLAVNLVLHLLRGAQHLQAAAAAVAAGAAAAVRRLRESHQLAVHVAVLLLGDRRSTQQAEGHTRKDPIGPANTCCSISCCTACILS